MSESVSVGTCQHSFVHVHIMCVHVHKVCACMFIWYVHMYTSPLINSYITYLHIHI